MEGRRQELRTLLESYYRSCGWRVEHAGDGTVRAAGIGGVTWIGLPVVKADLETPDFEERLVSLSEERMPHGGERCPLELLPDEECADEVKSLLDRLRLRERGHVEIYSVAA